MLQAVRNKTPISESKNTIGKFLKLYFILPVKSGLAGFAAFFSILVATKFLGYLLGTQPTFDIILDDVFLSLIGFVLIFLIRILENIKEEKN